MTRKTLAFGAMLGLALLAGCSGPYKGNNLVPELVTSDLWKTGTFR